MVDLHDYLVGENMNTKFEQLFTYLLALTFLVGTALLYLRFYTEPETNVYAQMIFLIALLIITLYYNKLLLFEFGINGLKAVTSRALELGKKEINKELTLERDFYKKYSAKTQIKKENDSLE